MFLILFCCVFTAWLQYAGAECPTIINRKEWNGVKPKHVLYLNTPVDLVVIQHTVTQTCSNDQTCVKIVQDLQKVHMNDAILWDIGPSFLIASTGKIYEGRGWNHVAVHTYGYNNQSIGIAFIGTFKNQEPSVRALDAARALIKCGVDENRLEANHHVVVHSQLLPTESPGKKLTSKIKLWPDWKQDVSEIKKRADNQDIPYFPDTIDTTDEGISSRTAGSVATAPDSTATGKSRSRRQILTTPKEIDLHSNARDVIAELIDNIRNLARESLNTAASLSRGVLRQVRLAFEQLTSRLRGFKDQVNFAADGISFIPGLDSCTSPIKEEANFIYDNAERRAKKCSDQRVNEVENLIKNLGTLSNNAINFSNIAVEQTRNCTEMNFGVEQATKACLNSVKTQTETTTNVFKTQKTLTLNTITSALEALPAALNLCAQTPLSNAGFETTRIISEIANCRPTFPFRLTSTDTRSENVNDNGNGSGTGNRNGNRNGS